MKASLRRNVLALFVFLAAWPLCRAAHASYVLLGSDYLETLPGTYFDFGGPIGPVGLTGLPINPGVLGTTDTIVQRQADASLPLGGPTTVPIELVQLSLVSVSPVTVGTASYDVFVHLTPSTSSLGTMTIRHEFPDTPGPGLEGTFDSFFDVFFTADFTEVGNPFNTFSVSAHTQLGSTGSSWSHDPISGALLVTGPSGNQDANDHTGRPPQFSDLHIPQQITEFKVGGGGAHVVQAAHGDQTFVPEPSALVSWLGLMGLGWLAAVARKRRRDLR